ncbi:uncharacterized protein TNCV_572341 [Trichonephila clavipes]|nr:uncharacterized protein TNCV_572341 [Trichonephila clavipes]
MTAQGLEKIIQKFEDTSSFHELSCRGRKRVNSTGLKKWSQQCRRCRSVVYSCPAFGDSPEHWKGLKSDFCCRISCSHGSGQLTAVENFVVIRSPFPSNRICQYTELLNMGNIESTRNSTSTTSSNIGYYVVRVYGIIYYRPYFFKQTGVFGPVTITIAGQRYECQ